MHIYLTTEARIDGRHTHHLVVLGPNSLGANGRLQHVGELVAEDIGERPSYIDVRKVTEGFSLNDCATRTLLTSDLWSSDAAPQFDARTPDPRFEHWVLVPRTADVPR